MTNDNEIKLPVELGDNVTFSKTVSESDVYLFAGITGDFAPNHVNEAYMSTTPYGKRLAHGVLVLGFASTASSLFFEKVDSQSMTGVSYGYNNIRFIKPVFINDTVTVHYEIAEVDPAELKSIAKIEIYNQRDELCLVGEHILKFFQHDES